MRKKIPVLSEKDIHRFWSKVELTANPNKCWNWTAYKHRGYGKFSVTVSTQRDLPVIATRIAYFLHHNIDPLKKLVLHTCDNPSCCNPNHLFLGTNKDNMDDMWNKKRANPPKGTDHWAAALTKKNVLDIRKMCSSGSSQAEAAQKYGIYPSVVSRIMSRKAWAHV